MSALHKLLDTVQIGFMTPTPDMIAEARAELAALRDELADWRDGAKRASEEMCGDEKHCTCVPALRSAVESARAEERERCARIVEAMPCPPEVHQHDWDGYFADPAAAAIRATGEAAETRT